MKKILLILFLVISLFSKEKEHIKVCYLEWGGYGGKNLSDYGLVPDISKTTLESAGYSVEMSILPWNRCLKLVEMKRYDMVAALWMSDELKKKYKFFEPMTFDSINFMTLNSLKIDSGNLEDFYGKSVAIMRGAGGLERFYKVKDKFKLFEVNTEKQLITLLKTGRIDAIVSDPVQTLSLVKQYFPELMGKIKVWSPSIQINTASPAVAIDYPDRDEIEKRYNTAFKKLVENGMFDRMIKKHKLKVTYEKYDEK